MATVPKKTAKAPQKTAAKPAAPKPATSAEELKSKQPVASVAIPPAAKQQLAATTPQAKEKTVSKEKPAKEKIKKAKLVRDSFTMPEDEYQTLGDLKKACVKAGFEVKKSELLRIGVALLKKLPPLQIQQALSALPPLKAGRPKKDK